MRRFAPIALALLLMLAPQARADYRPPDLLPFSVREATTQLGMRLASEYKYRDGKLSSIDLKNIRRAIESSDAEKDARADVDSGRIGLMTSGGHRGFMRAPGLRCPPAEVRKKAVSIYSYRDVLPKHEKEALDAFHAYARAYNLFVFNSGLLGDTSCERYPRR